MAKSKDNPPSQKGKVPMKSLETYLLNCPNHCDRYDFETQEEAYTFGKKLREKAMAEEGVKFPDQLTKFDVDISYQTVKIKLLEVPELASR